MSFRTVAASCVSIVTAVCAHAQTDKDWTPLFNGQDLTGWVSTGDPDAWTVRDGEIVTAKPGAGGWLRTTKMYRDFELSLSFYVPEGGNSGVGLRGSSAGDPAFTGFEVQILDTFGEAPGLRNCGAVYEAVAPTAMAVHKHGNWNTYRITLIGDTLNVWLNDQHIHTDVILDERGFFRKEDQPLPLNTRATTGYIAVQDHGHAFRYKHINIIDLSADPEPDGMVPLIQGMDANTPAGWFAEDKAEWTVEDGTLIGRKGPGHLFTKEMYTDFELRALVKANGRGNSGMYFRAKPNPDPNNPWPIGYEAQVDQHDPKNFTGCIYNAAWPNHIRAPITRDDAWFDYRIRVEADHIRTWINGVPMVDTHLDTYSIGHLAVQGHHEANVIQYKDIRVLTLGNNTIKVED